MAEGNGNGRKHSEKQNAGRPKEYNIDPGKVEYLAMIGLNNCQIALYYGCDEGLIRHSYSEFLHAGRMARQVKIREIQWGQLCKADREALSHMLKHDCKETDKSTVEHTGGIDINLSDGVELFNRAKEKLSAN